MELCEVFKLLSTSFKYHYPGNNFKRVLNDKHFRLRSGYAFQSVVISADPYLSFFLSLSLSPSFSDSVYISLSLSLSLSLSPSLCLSFSASLPHFSGIVTRSLLSCVVSKVLCFVIL